MDQTKVTTIKTLFTAQEIAAGESALSAILDLVKAAGNCAIQIELSGSGTGKFEWIGTLDDVDFIKPNNANDIVTAFTESDGPGTDGKHIYSFNVSLVKAMKIKITETGGGDPITVTVTIAIQ